MCLLGKEQKFQLSFLSDERAGRDTPNLCCQLGAAANAAEAIVEEKELA